MQQRGNNVMQSGYQDREYGLYLDELADLDTWEGYEFWSAQLEAQIESLADLEHGEGAQLRQAEQGERTSDVVPF
jgi:hypothetical protein